MRHRQVVERALAGRAVLIGFMPLAGDQHHVAGLRQLQRMSDRLPSPEFRYFTIVLGTQQTTGGNLAETLAKLSDVLRQRKKMRDKVQAMSSEAKASAGIIGSLPLFVMGALSFLAPDYVALLFTTETGRFMLAICVVVMGCGVMVMRKMINFDM